MSAPRHRPRRLGALMVAAAAAGSLGVATASCSSSATHTTAGTIASTVVSGPATTALPVPPKTPISVPTAKDGTSPDGSGCDPPEGDALPTGIWYGILKVVTPATATAPPSLGLDLACWFSGASAQAITGAKGPADSAFYVRNQSPRVYTVALIPNVAVVPLAKAPTGEPTGELGPATTGVAAAQALLSDGSDHGVWVLINQGVATVVQAQFHS